MKTICTIISGGEYSPVKFTNRESRFVIACDRGYEYAKRDGIVPDLFVGDFDSCRVSVDEGIKLLELPTVKDDTDTLAAVRYALDEGYAKIDIYCALGARLDHMLANLQTAAFAAEKGALVRISDSSTEIFVFSGPRSVSLPERKGSSLSVFSMSAESRGVSIRGAAYTLDGAVLKNTFPVGVSNEWRGDAEISVEEGVLAVVMSSMKSL